MSVNDWCVCKHHRDDHAQERYGDGACYAKTGKTGDAWICKCDQFRLTTRGGQRGSEAGCYS